MRLCGLRTSGVTEITGVPEPVEFPSFGAGKLVRVSEPRRDLSAGFAINCELWLDQVTTLLVGTMQMTGTRGPSTFPWEGRSGREDPGDSSQCLDPAINRNTAALHLPHQG